VRRRVTRRLIRLQAIYNFLNIANHGEITTKFQFTGAGAQQHRNRNFMRSTVSGQKIWSMCWQKPGSYYMYLAARAYTCVSGCVYVWLYMCCIILQSVFWYLLRLVCIFSCLTLLFFDCYALTVKVLKQAVYSYGYFLNIFFEAR